MITTRLVPAALLLVAAALPAHAQYVLTDYVAGFPELIGVDDAEFTPDGKLLVVRDNTIETTALVYDAATGAELFRYQATLGGWSGVCQDAVVVTDTRAVVIGSSVIFIDLQSLSVYAEFATGFRARDVALTPDESLLAVRGEVNQYLFDMATGALLAQKVDFATPWNPTGFEVDTVVVTDDHAVFSGYDLALHTEVTIWDLHPAGGGPPAIVYETNNASEQAGYPHDIAVTPDGRYAAVRSDLELGLYDLFGAAQLWVDGALADGFGGSAMDSVVATNTMVATISRRVTAGVGAKLDVFTVPAGVHKIQTLNGDPHDLDLNPDGSRLVVRTHKRLYLFDVASLPPHNLMIPLAEQQLLGNFTSWSAGLDSLFVTEDRVLAVSRQDNDSRVRVYDTSADSFTKVFGGWLGEPATDVAITPSGKHAVLSGKTAAMVIDLRLNEAVLAHDPANAGSYPWCDGVAVTDEQAAAFGYIQDNAAGWLSVIDLFSRADSYCDTNPNSTGSPATIVASGSSRISDNDLILTALDMPAGELGQFFYGDATQQTPVGDGFVCVGGQVARFAVQAVGAGGRAALAVDNGNLPPGGGALTAGSTWHFQFVYRDAAGASGTFNLTDGVSVLFE